MKVIIFYFDPKAIKIFIEKINDDGAKSIALSSSHNFVNADEIVAKVVNIDSPDDVVEHLDNGYNYYNVENYTPLKTSGGIYFDQEHSVYKATKYGFVIFDKNNSALRLLSPLQITKDNINAYYIIHPTKFKSIPSYGDISEVLSNNKILASLDTCEIEDQLNKIDVNTPHINRITIAKGLKPVYGFDEYYIPLIDFEKKAGKVKKDGSIDFKETGSIIEVKKGQEILKKIPEVKPKDGYNIYGEKVKAENEESEENKGYIKGENILQSTDELIYVSAIDGCLEVHGSEISVSSSVLITGDIDYDTGNIDFDGSVHISGSVLPGFSVKAQGDINVGKSIDNATIEAGGNITVNLGIGGKGETKVKAGGFLQAKYILNSNVEAMGEIKVKDSIINSNVFSNKKISVTDKHGKIIGGETIALQEIHVKVSGVPKENKTILTVGRSIYIEKEIMEIKEKIEPLKEEVAGIYTKIKTSFGEEVLKNPKEFISILPPVRKKPCLQLLSDLNIRNKELKELTQQCEEVENKLQFDKEPTIMVENEVHPGTVIKIKKKIRAIDEKLDNVKFYEDPERKIVLFVSAV